MAKLNEEDIRVRVEENGMILNSYSIGTRNRIFVNVSCEQGHTYDIRLDSLMASNGCKYCNKTARYTYEEVKEYVESQGYILISDDYTNVNKQITVQCDKGHIYDVTFGNFKHRNSRCPICNGGVRLSYEYVKEYIEKEDGYRLISKVYVNSKEKLKIKCNNGHMYEATFGCFRAGHRCNICSKTNKLTYEYVKEYVESFGYKLISDKYENKDSKLDVECDKGHRYSVTFGNFNKGYRCPVCYTLKRRISYSDVKQYVEKEGYELISKNYTNNDKKITFKCDKSHVYKATFSAFKNRNQRCPVCNESKGERRVRKFLEDMGVVFVVQKEYDGLVGIGGLPLRYDFYLPDYKKLIEYQGEFHDGTVSHQTEKEFKYQLEHDKRKRIHSEIEEIDLLEIWYWDFDNIEEILTRELKLNK